jgi:hypothetical protein
VIVQSYGFLALFEGVIIFIILSAFLPILISKQMRTKDGKAIFGPEIKIVEPPAPKE